MLQDFLKKNRTALIDRCRAMGASRSEPGIDERRLLHVIPVFLDQIIKTLTVETASDSVGRLQKAANLKDISISEVGKMASLHGRDLLDQGFTLEQVVRDYGDLCQCVMNLAYETGALIEVAEYRTFNRCLDDAIAAAVTEYANRQTAAAVENNNQAVNLRLGPLAHELRAHLDTASIVVRAIKAGNVGISGATGAVLDRSLLSMRKLIDGSITEMSESIP